MDPVIVLLIVVIVICVMALAVIVTLTVKDYLDRKSRRELSANNPYMQAPQPTQAEAETKEEKPQGPYVVKIDTTQVSTIINNFLEKLADELVEQPFDNKLGYNQEEIKALENNESNANEDNNAKVNEQVVNNQEVKENEAIVTSEEVIETPLEEDEEETESTVVVLEASDSSEEEAPKAPKEKKEIYPTPAEIASYATEKYDDIEIRYGKDEENFKILRKKKVILICQRTNSDYRITYQRKPISATKMMNKYPKSCVKAYTPEGEQWFKITNKGDIEKEDILALVEYSHKYMEDLEAKAALKKEKAKERAKAKRARERAKAREAAKKQKEREEKALEKQKLAEENAKANAEANAEANASDTNAIEAALVLEEQATQTKQAPVAAKPRRTRSPKKAKSEEPAEVEETNVEANAEANAKANVETNAEPVAEEVKPKRTRSPKKAKSEEPVKVEETVSQTE